MEITAFEYELPPERIAQEPLARRDAARLLVDRGPDQAPVHQTVADLPELLAPGDLLVVNTTRVLPGRLALRRPTGGAAEVLLLEPRPEHAAVGADGGEVWEALVRPSRKLAPGSRLHPDLPYVPDIPGGAQVPDGSDASSAAGAARASRPQAVALEVVVHDDLGEGRRLVEVIAEGGLLAALDRYGRMPLPPYITAPLAERDRYQTVYAERPGSAAAPTAGLHLTPEVLRRCAERGIGRAEVELVVGLGTFRPIAADVVEDHVMHHEAYRVPASTMAACDATRASGGRVVAVGTTSVRALESAAATGQLEGRTDLFIHRPYGWRVVDRLLTNFHMPRSSLLVMIDAFVGPRWRDLYDEALASDYRFLSFGDAMLLSRDR